MLEVFGVPKYLPIRLVWWLLPRSDAEYINQVVLRTLSSHAAMTARTWRLSKEHSILIVGNKLQYPLELGEYRKPRIEHQDETMPFDIALLHHYFRSSCRRRLWIVQEVIFARYICIVRRETLLS